jgi:thiol-disulfide isomerase/thioredoxin
MRQQLYLFLIILSSCSSNHTELNENEIPKNSNITISGEISGAINQPLTLEFVDAKGSKELATATISEDGNFKLSTHIDELGLYQLRLGMGSNKIIPLTLEPKDKVVIKADFQTFELKPSISGTKWAKTLTTYMLKFSDFALAQTELMNKKALTQEEQIAEFLNIRKPLDLFAQQQISKDPSNPVNLVLSTSLTPAMGFEYWDSTYLQVLKQMSAAFLAKYKTLPFVNEMQEQINQIELAFINYKELNSGEKLAPEIALNDPKGKEIKLSSLRGQVVLIDFWASWCGPCRKENPNVVKLYQKYKSKGFTIYSVSLDRDPVAWEKAIKADGLIWSNHVSDLKEWQTPLIQSYNFNSIPYTVLVDRNGKIIATNLRGEILERKLKEIL